MSFKTLLVHVEATLESDMRLQAAVGLARHLGASLIGVAGCEAAYLDNCWVAAGADPIGIQAIKDCDKDELVEAEVRFRTLAGPLGSGAIWRPDADYPDRALQAYAAGADLIVASAHRGPRSSTAAAADLVMQAGLPVLTVPFGQHEIRAGSIVIGWKNTREARRAVSDAMPLLVAARQVTIVELSSSGEAAPNASHDIVGRLERQGVQASVQRLEERRDEPCDVLIDFALGHKAELVVAGAYGHSRMREWTLGGMTSDLLEQTRLPVFFSH
jgi:nucleotide-binding universal stress UspA family protein